MFCKMIISSSDQIQNLISPDAPLAQEEGRIEGIDIWRNAGIDDNEDQTANK